MNPTHRLIATGALVFPEGYALDEIEALPEDFWPARELEAAKLEAVAYIDWQAEKARERFLTPGAGQALTYQRKESEARAWTENADPADFPFLSAEASATGVTVSELAAIVIAQADLWATVGAQIEGLRMGAKKAVRDGAAVEAVKAATAIDWPEA